jgi:hypothetical protein
MHDILLHKFGYNSALYCKDEEHYKFSQQHLHNFSDSSSIVILRTRPEGVRGLNRCDLHCSDYKEKKRKTSSHFKNLVQKNRQVGKFLWTSIWKFLVFLSFDSVKINGENANRRNGQIGTLVRC